MAVTCSNPECKISETGMCIEGFVPVDDCLNYGKELEDLAIDATVSLIPDIIVEPNIVFLEPGIILDNALTDKLLRKYGGQVIACIGPSDIGKTTLLASIYEFFNKGSTPNYSFGGSKTLYDFEEICHHSRAISQNKEANTLRTPRKNVASFYHLALNNHNKNQRIDLLLADRAGEEYEDAVNSSENCSNLYEVKRSDVLMIIIDGCALSKNRERHSAKQYTENIVRALMDENMLTSQTKVLVVMTRYDLAFIDGSATKALTELEKVTNKIDNMLNVLGINVSSHVVAARPTSTDEMKVPHGISELIEKISTKIPPTTINDGIKVKVAQRNFHRFGE